MGVWGRIWSQGARAYRGCRSDAVRTMSSQPNSPVKLAYASFQSTKTKLPIPPLLIIHGLFGSRRNWESLAKAMSTKGVKVITVDARNHGESPHADDMSYLAMSRDIESLMHELDIPEAIILGHSMGGKIAMTLALTQPHLVSKLIVEDVAPDYSRAVITTGFPEYIQAMQGVEFDKTLSLTAVRKQVDQQLRPVFSDSAVRAFILTNIESGIDGHKWRVNLNAIEQNLENLIGFPKFPSIYEGDTIFIGGVNSNHIQIKLYPEIKRLFPKVQIQHIAGAGHWVHADKPHEFMNSVMKFITKDIS